MRKKLEQLKASFGPEHPEVKTLERQIEALGKQIQEALQERIDQLPQERRYFNPFPDRFLIHSPPDPELDPLRQAYAQAEQETQLKARSLRDANTTEQPDNPRTDQRRQDVQATVEAAFAARQRLQQNEVKALQRRLEEVKQSIRAREQNKAAIIQHRVEELLNPSLEWDATQLSPSARGNELARSASEGMSANIHPRHSRERCNKRSPQRRRRCQYSGQPTDVYRNQSKSEHLAEDLIGVWKAVDTYDPL